MEPLRTSALSAARLRRVGWKAIMQVVVYRPGDEPDRPVAALHGLAQLHGLVNRASLARIGAASTLLAGVIAGLLLVVHSEQTVEGSSRPFVGLGIGVFAICGALALLLWLVASWVDVWHQVETNRLNDSSEHINAEVGRAS